MTRHLILCWLSWVPELPSGLVASFHDFLFFWLRVPIPNSTNKKRGAESILPMATLHLSYVV